MHAPSHDSQAGQILQLLRAQRDINPDGWTNAWALELKIRPRSLNPATRVADLRKRGFDIENTEHHPDGRRGSWYRLTYDPDLDPAPQTTPQPGPFDYPLHIKD